MHKFKYRLISTITNFDIKEIETGNMIASRKYCIDALNDAKVKGIEQHEIEQGCTGRSMADAHWVPCTL